ncbi:MAG: hypothetical protein GXO42_03030 [bacterium]|nr:hypothetical protein [bacterium]
MQPLQEIAALLVLAAVFSLLFRFLKQPSVIAYIVLGWLLGTFFLKLSPVLQLLGSLGIASLLFITGLHLKPRELLADRQVVAVGTLQFLLLTLLYVPLFYFLQHSLPAALFLAASSSFASTVIATKLLSDTKELDTFHGRKALGILVLQDIFAAVLIFFAGVGKLNFPVLAGLVALLVFFNTERVRKLLDKLLAYMARFPEELFLLGFGWFLGIGLLFSWAGLSLDLGALVAGMLLGEVLYKEHLEARLRPLRDFFLLFFFVYLGAQIHGFPAFKQLVFLLLAAAFLVSSKLGITYLLGRRYWSRKTSLQVALYLSTASEFSFILAYLAEPLLQINLAQYYLLLLFSIFFAVGLIQAKKLLLKVAREQPPRLSHSYRIILLGCDRLGSKIAWKLRELGLQDELLVVDINPQIVRDLLRQGYRAIYADAADAYFLESLSLDKTELLVSTLPSPDDNALIIKHVKFRKPELTVVVVASTVRDALQLYKAGADYVVLPYFLAAEVLAEMVEQFCREKQLPNTKLEELVKRLCAHQEHPEKL